MVDIESFVRGYYAYMTVWEPRIGEVLVLQGEPHNPEDQLAVLVVKSRRTVRHMPFNLAPIFSHFLKRSFNKGTAEITGEKVKWWRLWGERCPASVVSMGQRLTLREARPCLAVT